MPTYTLADVERAVRESWCDETRPPECQAEWDPSNPSRDQCGVTEVFSVAGWQVVATRRGW
ncbi:YunG family protein [Pseudonocardia sp. Ae707_Ps2]|uniref:YunG family protein n=1 Tax=Pseudonocardia sp. Ae707_Ps2 TaxID=2212992 RepID=UPI003FD028D8